MEPKTNVSPSNPWRHLAGTPYRLRPGQQLRPESGTPIEQTQVSRVFTDKASGKDTQRPQLEALLSFVREGDTVVVHSMDRLARNLDDLRHLVQKRPSAVCVSSS